MVYRLFFAIPLPDECKTALQAPFRHRKHYGIRWVKSENLHITLHFIGAVTGHLPPEFSHAVAAACNQFLPFDLKLSGFRAVLKRSKPVMIWAQFEQQPHFDHLCTALSKIFPGDESLKPTPHVTLARIRQLHQLPFELPCTPAYTLKVDTVALWNSTLLETGAEYKSLSSWKLRAALRGFGPEDSSR